MKLASELREWANREAVHKMWTGKASALMTHAADALVAAELALMEHGYVPDTTPTDKGEK